MIDIALITGPQGSGKTTISDDLCRQAKISEENKAKWGYDCITQLKFATPLYTLHEFILNKMEGWRGVPRIKKDGVLLQLLGTEWGRNTLADDIWIQLAKIEIETFAKRCGNSKGLVIIDDGRFPNEFDAFPEALRIRLECPEDVRKVRCPAWRSNTQHISETALDAYAAAGKFDLYLDTDGDELVKCTTLILAQLQKKNWIEKRKVV